MASATKSNAYLITSKDGRRSAVIAATEAVHHAAYDGRLGLTGATGEAMTEAQGLAWIAAERAVALSQAEAFKAERADAIAARGRAAREAREAQALRTAA